VRRTRRSGITRAALLACALLLFPRSSLAVDARAEAAAKDALKKAAADFAASDYASAAARLDKAGTTCGINRCAHMTRALVARDLGTMQFRLGDKAAAANAFADALKLEPDLSLNSKYDAPDVHAAWEQAKQAVGAQQGGKPANKPAGSKPGEQPTGDFTHAPADEQEDNTPLPIFVEYGGESAPSRVTVKYRGAGMAGWGHLDLTKTDDGWGGQIPCHDVKVGVMRYWVQGFDSSGEPMANSGDPRHTYSVPIRDTIVGEAPHLPDKPAPHQCSKHGGGEGGEPGAGEGEEEGGAAGAKEGEGASRQGYSRLWLGLAGAVDFLSLPSSANACALTDPGGAPINHSNLYCTNPDGSDFPSRDAMGRTNNMAIQAPGGNAGHIGGGLQAGDVRLLLSADYALKPQLLVGGRIGYVANAYSGSAASKDGRAAGFRIHVEARATYLFGVDPLAHAGFAPMAFAGLGLAEFDGHTGSLVTESFPPPQPPVSQPVNVWLTSGPFFLLVGGGVRYQFSPRAAFTGALRINMAVGNGVLFTYGPEIGFAYGF